MNGRASSFGAITIVNAIAGGRGATASVGLRTEVKVEMTEGVRGWQAIVNGQPSTSSLPAETVRQTLVASDLSPGRFGGTIETLSSIPMGVGLKSSSSSSVAISLAVLDALGRDDFDVNAVLRCSVRASLLSKVSITGAMDDAASCLLGGVNMADNLRVKLVDSRHFAKQLDVLIKVPDEKSRRGSMNLTRVKKLKRICDSIFDMSLDGEYWSAMTLNGILYSCILGYPSEHSLQALELGALGAGLSGTGPAVAAIFDRSQRSELKRLKREWSRDGSAVLETSTNDEKGKILG